MSTLLQFWKPPLPPLSLALFLLASSFAPAFVLGLAPSPFAVPAVRIGLSPALPPLSCELFRAPPSRPLSCERGFDFLDVAHGLHRGRGIGHCLLRKNSCSTTVKVNDAPQRGTGRCRVRLVQLADCEGGKRKARHRQLPSASGTQETFPGVPIRFLERWCSSAADDFDHLGDVILILRHDLFQRLGFFGVIFAALSLVAY